MSNQRAPWFVAREEDTVDQSRQTVSVIEEAISPHDTTITSWDVGRQALAEARTYWLSTGRPGGQPHVRPHFAVWVGDALYFSSNLAARKAQNLAADPRCAISTQSGGLDFVVEGEAKRVTDEATLQRVADAYIAKYEWPVTVSDSAFDAPFGAPTAGQLPYHVFEVTPATIYGFGNGPVTRWRFT
jgi:nitroimidazol reductase NimA-like FMN-containing flavoprotein (pyridoxamine 5'-phosphate oxidase superfamily)